jgi:hypothetical protein
MSLKRNGDMKPCPECRKPCRPYELAKEANGHRHICAECRDKEKIPALLRVQAG